MPNHAPDVLYLGAVRLEVRCPSFARPLHVPWAQPNDQPKLPWRRLPQRRAQLPSERLQRLVALALVARDARGHEVEPLVAAALRHWHNMVECQVLAGAPAVLARVAVANEHVAPRARDVRRDFIQIEVPAPRQEGGGIQGVGRCLRRGQTLEGSKVCSCVRSPPLA
eukprot:353695-Chlamydomonas_euryale.AAC.15